LGVIYIGESGGRVGVTRESIDPARLRQIGQRTLIIDSSTHIYYLTGPLFFGSVHPVLEAFESARDYRAIVISMRGVPLIDAMGSQALTQIIEEQRHRGGTISFSGLQPAVREMFARTGLLKTIGEENIFWSADQAIMAIHGGAGPAESATTG